MKILFLCGREAEYPLNYYLIESLKRFSYIDVVHQKGSGKSILKRSLEVTLQGVNKLRSNHYDLIFVGFLGHFLMLTISVFTKQPILFHPLISIFDTLVSDRKKFSRYSVPAQVAFWIDKKGCNKATQIILDTHANIAYFANTFSIPSDRFDRIFVGCDERIFYPRTKLRQDSQVTVLYQGSYLPLHGVDIIIKAAHILKNHSNIRFRMIGSGMGYERIYKLSAELNLSNIEFFDSVPFMKMPKVIGEADICLGGHFSRSDKASRVISGKTFQDIAMGKPTIVGDNPANKELLTHGYDAWFSRLDNPEDLAFGIKKLATNSTERLMMGANARQTFLDNASLEIQTPKIRKIIEKIVNS